MSFIRRVLKRSLDDLVTGIVVHKGERWTLIWAAGGRAPSDASFDSAGAAIECGNGETARRYTGRSEALTAELQYAIYPWADGGDSIEVLDVTANSDGLLEARDMQSGTVVGSGGVIDEVIESAGQALDDPGNAMLRWIIRVRDLSA